MRIGGSTIRTDPGKQTQMTKLTAKKRNPSSLPWLYALRFLQYHQRVSGSWPRPHRVHPAERPGGRLTQILWGEAGHFRPQISPVDTHTNMLCLLKAWSISYEQHLDTKRTLHYITFSVIQQRKQEKVVTELQHPVYSYINI